jgi:TM2 domain-containing membrane protein YozV
MFCSKCGTSNSEGDVYCRQCGLPLNPTAQAPNPIGKTASSHNSTSYLPHSISDKLPSMVKVELIKMSAERQSLFVEEYRRKKKNTGVAYLLWFVIGLHYVYLGKVGWQFFYWLTIGGVLIWAFIDIFRIPGMVKNYNKDVAIDVFRDLKMSSA